MTVLGGGHTPLMEERRHRKMSQSHEFHCTDMIDLIRLLVKFVLVVHMNLLRLSDFLFWLHELRCVRITHRQRWQQRIFMQQETLVWLFSLDTEAAVLKCVIHMDSSVSVLHV